MSKIKEEKCMERTVGVRVNDQFYRALNKSKWLLEKEVSRIVREAIMEYGEKHLSKKDLQTVMKMLDDAPELKEKEKIIEGA